MKKSTKLKKAIFDKIIDHNNYFTLEDLLDYYRKDFVTITLNEAREFITGLIHKGVIDVEKGKLGISDLKVIESKSGTGQGPFVCAIGKK